MEEGRRREAEINRGRKRNYSRLERRAGQDMRLLYYYWLGMCIWAVQQNESLLNPESCHEIVSCSAEKVTALTGLDI